MQNNFNPQQFGGAYYIPPINTNNEHNNHRKNEARELITTGLVLGGALFFFLINQVIAVGILQLTDYYTLFQNNVVFQHAFNILAVHFLSLLLPFGIACLILRKRYIAPVIPTQKVKKSTMVYWVFLGLGICFSGNFVVSFLVQIMNKIGYDLDLPNLLEPKSTVEYLIMIFSTAIVPAIFEELAMRCFSLGALRKYGNGFAVFAVSIIFGLVHGNVIQFVFAFIVGLVLGYITIKTNNITIAIFIHMLNNGISVFQTIMKSETNEKITATATSILVVIIFALACISLVMLIKNKELLPKKNEIKASKSSLNFGEKFVCLIPGLIIPFISLIAISATTITKV